MRRTGNAADPVNDIVHHLFANSVVSTSIIIRGILFTTDQELGVKELAVAAGPDFINRGGVQIDEDGARNVFATTRLREEGLERAGVSDILCVGVGTAIGSQAVL